MSLYHRQSGDPRGQPLLLLHGGSFSGDMWDEILPMLSAYQLIIPDLPGHGRSRKTPLLSFEQAAEEVAILLNRLANDCGLPVRLVGLSMGGYIALHLLARHPGLVSRALISGIHIAGLPQPQLMIALGTVISPMMQFAWFRGLMVRMMGIEDHGLTTGKDGTVHAPPATMRQIMRLAAGFDGRKLVRQVNCPLLMLAGEREHDLIIRSLDDFARRSEHVTTGIIPDLGHGWCLQNRQLCARLITAWMDELPLPAPLRGRVGSAD